MSSGEQEEGGGKTEHRIEDREPVRRKKRAGVETGVEKQNEKSDCLKGNRTIRLKKQTPIDRSRD